MYTLEQAQFYTLIFHHQSNNHQHLTSHLEIVLDQLHTLLIHKLKGRQNFPKVTLTGLEDGQNVGEGGTALRGLNHRLV